MCNVVLSLSLSLQLLRNMKGQFTGLLYDTGFVPSSDPKHSSANVNSDNMKLVKAVLCAGLYPNVFKVDQTKPGRLVRSKQHLLSISLQCAIIIMLATKRHYHQKMYYM